MMGHYWVVVTDGPHRGSIGYRADPSIYSENQIEVRICDVNIRVDHNQVRRLTTSDRAILPSP